MQLPVDSVHFLQDKIPFKMQNVQSMLDEQNVEGPDVVFAIKKNIMLVFNTVQNYMSEMCPVCLRFVSCLCSALQAT